MTYQPRSKMKKYALCVGINDYPGTNSDLSGCVNDANDWSAALQAKNYEVVEMLDAQASKQAVIAALQVLVRDARFGDRIVFTYSGHGSWIPDNNGDESDGRDEVLCLHDYASGGLLSDDEIYSIFNERRFGVRVMIFSDSCHSGSVSRFVGIGSNPRFISPLTFLSEADLERARRINQRILPAGRPRPSTVLISGCDDHEYSYDAWFGSRPNGAFTRAAIDALGVDSNIREWFAAIRKRLPSSDYPQSPQLAATRWQSRWTL